MSRKLHVATTYKVEWSDLSAFNHRPYEFRILLNELGVGVCSMSSSDYDDYLDFEVTKDDWKTAIHRLENLEFIQEPKRVAIKEQLKELDCTPEKAVELFKQLLDVAEPDEEWLHFSFF